MLLDEDWRRSLEPNCADCSDPEKRARWGCDTDAEEPWDYLVCRACDRQPQHQRDRCTACEGTGRVGITRCPRVMVGEREIFAVQAAIQMADTNLLPFADCGWAELPATLYEAISIVCHERADIQDRERERNLNRAK